MLPCRLNGKSALDGGTLVLTFKFVYYLFSPPPHSTIPWINGVIFYSLWLNLKLITGKKKNTSSVEYNELLLYHTSKQLQ